MIRQMVGKYKNTGTTLSKKHYQDAGQDICSSEEIVIPPRGSAVISTNLFLAIPMGCVGLIWSRSGLSVKHQLEVGAGCIDSNYRGEVKVHLYNHSDTEYIVHTGDRIAQLLTIPVILEPYQMVNDIDETDRGESGFGSTGK